MHDSGDVILAMIQFTDTFEVKKRPALILYKNFDNLVVAGITSNKAMQGINITKKEGAIKDSVIKLNYIFTISSAMIQKKLFTLNKEKRKEVYNAMTNNLNSLIY